MKRHTISRLVPMLILLAIALQGQPLEGADLYILSVGIEPDLTRKGKFDLYSYDAKHVSTALARAKPVYANINISVLNGKEATARSVLSHIRGMAESMRKEDVAVIFFSSHGEIEKGKGYYFTLAPDGRKKYSYLYAKEFNDVVSKMKGRAVVLADTCCAAGLIPKEETSRISYLVASKADESSYGQEKDADRPHGYFVIALCEGLAGMADAGDCDGIVTLEELASYIAARTSFLCKEQTAVSSIHAEARDLRLANVGERDASPQKESKTRNPFGHKDVANPNDEVVKAFLRKARHKTSKHDQNAKQWNYVEMSGDRSSLNGEWQSRWSEGTPKWHLGRAWIMTSGARIYLSYKDNSSDYLMELIRIEGDRIGGRYMNLDDASDTGPWIGYVISPERIDGYFPGGRWDLRRRIRKQK